MFAHNQVSMPERSLPTVFKCNSQGGELSLEVAEGQRNCAYGRTVCAIQYLGSRGRRAQTGREKRAAKSGRNGRAARIRDRSTL